CLACAASQPLARAQDAARRDGCRARDIYRRDLGVGPVPIRDAGRRQNDVCLSLADNQRSVGLALVFGPAPRTVHRSQIRLGTDGVVKAAGIVAACLAASRLRHLARPTRTRFSDASSPRCGYPKTPKEAASCTGSIGASRSSSRACSCCRCYTSPTSVRFSTISSDMVDSGYFRALALSLLAWLGLYLIFTWTI